MTDRKMLEWLTATCEKFGVLEAPVRQVRAHLAATASPTGPAKEHGPAMTLTTGLAIGGRTVIQPGMVISTPRVPLDLAELPAVKRWQEANPPIRAILLRELRLGATEWRLAADALEAIAEAGRG
jgi:hypothetical protein